eukprot:4185295-Alexandrium_andersonii.AAC.1
MSASLVGSEMCIRDREKATTQERRTWMVRLSGTSCDTFRGQDWATHPGAVSYTHLTLPTICSV